MGDSALSSPCGCKSLSSGSLLSLPTGGQPCRADWEQGATNRPHSRAVCFYGSRNAGGFGKAPRGQCNLLQFLPPPGLHRGLQGDPTLSPSQERDFSLHRGNPTVSSGLPPSPTLSLPPLPCPVPSHLPHSPRQWKCSLESFKIGNHTKLCLMAS